MRPAQFASACLLTMVFAVIAAAADDNSIVHIETGSLAGITENGNRVYRGIPYAAPPVGEQRWRPPEPAESWDGIRDASQFGPVCPQQNRERSPESIRAHYAAAGMDEDCLTLNIWTPISASAESASAESASTASAPTAPSTSDTGNSLLPVMLYLHGGNMQFGAGSLPVHDGGVLAGEGVVLVNINYRINFLGRFAHPAMTRVQKAEPLVNYGLMDQIAALEWVQQNIRAFGGDPGNVTIFGHSAGGVSVNYLMATPASKGLFHKAIAQGSGVGVDFNRHAFERGPVGAMEQSQEDLGVMMADYFGITGSDGEIVDALRALTIEQVLEFHATTQISFNPAVDGVIVTDHIARIFERGEQHDVPYLAGANSWEWNQIDTGIPLIGKWFMANEFLRGYNDDDLAPFDDEWTRIGVSQRWFSENIFLMSTRYLAAQMTNVSSPAWLYHVTYVQANIRGEVPGAAHGAEMPFVFGNVVARPELARPQPRRPDVVELTEEDYRWGDRVRGYWVNFAKTGNPNGPGLPEWPAYVPDTDIAMDLGVEIVPRPALYKETLDYLERRALVRREEVEAPR